MDAKILFNELREVIVSAMSNGAEIGEVITGIAALYGTIMTSFGLDKKEAMKVIDIIFANKEENSSKEVSVH